MTTNKKIGYHYPLSLKKTIFPFYYTKRDDILKCKTNIGLELEHDSTTIIFKFFMIPLNINLNDILYFEIYNHLNTFSWKIPFILLIESIRIIDNNYCIKIKQEALKNNYTRDNQDYFKIHDYFEFPIFSCMWSIIYIRLVSINKIDFDYELIIDYVSYNDYDHNNKPIRKQMAYEDFQLYVYNYDIIELKEINNFKSDLLCNNIYIKLDNPINNFELILDNYHFLDLNRTRIKIYNNLKKREYSWTKEKYMILNNIFNDDIINNIKSYLPIYEYLLYNFPIELTENKVYSNINMSCIKNNTIKIKTLNEIYNGYIIIKGMSILIFKSGFVGLVNNTTKK